MATVAANPIELDAADVASLPDLLAPSVSLAVLSKPEYSDYLTHLTDLPLPSLESEPSTLQSSSAQLTNALTTLCHTSYPTFLSLHTTTSTLSSSLGSLSSSLDSLLSALPSLESSARTFAQETREIQKERRQATLVLEQHDKLYDVLSLPMLLDSCVRNHNYNEALLLSNHASSLLQRFPSNPLIQSVKAECDARVQAMLGQLLSMLREPAKLPALFRSVNFLRKMEKRKASEGDKEKDKESYARFLKRYVDVWREGVYDVVTQYTTIFLDKAASTSSAPPADLHILIRMFTTSQLQALLSLLRETLPLIPDPAMLTSLLKQLTYCANSFARVGMDFKALLSPIFIDAVRGGITQELEDATASWSNKLFNDKSKSSSTPKHALKLAPAHAAPQILTSYPPLALYTNALLTALNSLRMLAPVELYSDLMAIMERTLTSGRLPWKALEATGRVFFLVFVPFVVRALSEGVYGRPVSGERAVGGGGGDGLKGVRESWEGMYSLELGGSSS
ncbi:Dor1-like family-domain-containing protein [Irpex lacteus]|nr:Dor1-like family-domain-containing protein [Irpex lacteus]